RRNACRIHRRWSSAYFEEQAALMDQAFEGGTTVAGREGGVAGFLPDEERPMRTRQPAMTPEQTRAAIAATGGGETDPQGRPIGPGTEARERASAERERRLEERGDFNQARRSQTAETRRFREIAESEGLTGRAAEIRGRELQRAEQQAAEDRAIRREAQETQLEMPRSEEHRYGAQCTTH
ncbi:hypothetical protein RZS08_18660, partial [Arthrospira platensis SPKY1]|nr:hypothetical protein [Arthrospira platensis SPKY1]